MYFYHTEMFENKEVFNPPSIEEFLALIKEIPDRNRSTVIKNIILGNLKPTKLRYKVHAQSDKAIITLHLDIEPASGYPPSIELARIHIATVPANCSSLFISELRVGSAPGIGLGNQLLNCVLTYAKKANYSFVFCNISGALQLTLRDPLTRRGFKRMALPYKNPRSLNINEWWYTTMNTKEIEDKPVGKKKRATKPKGETENA